MPEVDVMQEMFVSASPPIVADRLSRPDVRRALWPDLAVTVGEDRATAGQRYLVDGGWRGSAELWLEPVADGVVVHSYLRVDRVGRAPSRRARAAAQRVRARDMRRALWCLKDELEGGRPPGTPVPEGTAR